MKHFEHTNKQFTINKLHKREKKFFHLFGGNNCLKFLFD